MGSRVEGYLNLTVLKYVALKKNQSLAWAYNELYGRGKTDVAFHTAATEAEADAAAAAAASAAAAGVGGVAAQAGDGALVPAVPHVSRVARLVTFTTRICPLVIGMMIAPPLSHSCSLTSPPFALRRTRLQTK